MSLDRAARSEGNGRQTRGQAKDDRGETGGCPVDTGGGTSGQRVSRDGSNEWSVVSPTGGPVVQYSAMYRAYMRNASRCVIVIVAHWAVMSARESMPYRGPHAAARGRLAAATRRMWPLDSMRRIACGQFRGVAGIGRRPGCRPFSAAICGKRLGDGATAQAKRNALRGRLRSRSSTGTQARRRTIRLFGPRRAPVSLRGASMLATSRPAESQRTSYRD